MLVIACFFPTYPSKLNMAMLSYIFLLCPLANRPSYHGFNDDDENGIFKEFDIGLVQLNSALRLSDYVQVDKNNKNTPVNKYKKF